MTQVEVKSVPTLGASRSVLHRTFVARLIVSSVSSLAGLISFVLTGPVMCRLAAVDPALEAFYRRMDLVSRKDVVAHL